MSGSEIVDDKPVAGVDDPTVQAEHASEPPEDGETKTKAKAAKTAAKKPAADSGRKKPKAGEKAAETESKPSAARPRPAAPSRPSIYENITNTAKRLEAERAAKSAAQKATAASQSAAAKASAAAVPASKKPPSPFLTTSIGPVSSRKPVAPQPEVVTPAPGLELAAMTPQPPEPAVPAPTPPVSAPVGQAESPAAIAAGPVVTPAAPTPAIEDARAATATSGESPKTEPAKAVAPAVVLPPKPTGAPIPPIPAAKPPLAKPELAKPAPGKSMPPKASPPQARPAASAAAPSVPPPARTQAPRTGQKAPVPAPSQPASKRAAPQRPPSGPQPARTHHKFPPRQAPAPAPKPVAPPPPAVPAGPVALPAVTTVRELASLMNIPIGEMLKKLMTMGIFATINQSLDYDTASLIAEEFDIKTKPLEVAAPIIEVKSSALRAAADASKGQLRPPIVTILGHVDHGKTSLLDAIRHADVAAGEAGGITQHIGAYQIEKQGRKITFLDTPGHEAFTAMRARGAQVTDVAVLVVAADDGVMPQTIEAINHARAATVPIVVALNKIDRETADPARAMRQLSDAGVLVEDWGGDVPMVKVSAKKMTGIDELLDMILLVADLAEHRADASLPAVGTVVEAEMDRNRGPVATLLVQNGTMRQNDYLVVGAIQGRIRAMFDDRGTRLTEAGPSTPAVVLGLPTVPEAGMTFQVVADERTARTLADKAAEPGAQSQGMRAAKALSLDDLYAQMQAGKMHELNLILKADVQGSLEPIRSSLEKLSTESLRVRILHQGLGNISESDVSLALASNAIVIGFSVEPDPAAKGLATMEGVDVRVYNIIYKLIEDVDKALKGLLEPTYKEVISGRAEVRQVFKVNKKPVAGCYILDGKAVRSGQARVLRASKPIFDGRVASLKRFTEDAREVLTGFECGVMLEGFDDYQIGDIIEFYHKEKEE